MRGRRREQQEQDQEALMTADEVASLMQVTSAWVYAESRRGALPHVRLGRYVRFRRSAINRWLDDSERGPRTTQRPEGAKFASVVP
ncbi:helix-turn-helix domain-containing protein [Baekduia sp. Peel2402]|uniref:helix-turn-helix domain-containing protein n=1 Tax=Baekduia sp. Peel2402 TaxID=3458296 RepID=UPI00403EDA5C